MKRKSGSKQIWLLKDLIWFVTLLVSTGSVVSLYQTQPVPLVSTSAQYAAMMARSLASGNASGVKLLTAIEKEMSPLLLTCSGKQQVAFKLLTESENEIGSADIIGIHFHEVLLYMYR